MFLVILVISSPLSPCLIPSAHSHLVCHFSHEFLSYVITQFVCTLALTCLVTASLCSQAACLCARVCMRQSVFSKYGCDRRAHATVQVCFSTHVCVSPSPLWQTRRDRERDLVVSNPFVLSQIRALRGVCEACRMWI